MIAMQYSFALPADYDMDIIDRRITDKGHALDQHQPLIFKAYCVARKAAPRFHSNENLYAPFYLWQDTRGMGDFLSGPGFKAVSESFGWPSVMTWPLVMESAFQGLSSARFATRSISRVAPFTSLDDLRKQAREEARKAMEDGSVGVVTAVDPMSWTLVRFRAWRTASIADLDPFAQAYEVRHVSNPSQG